MQAMIRAAFLILVAVFCMGMVAESDSVPNNAVLVTETCTVAQGDTLDGIAKRYMARNTYAPRDVREFREGIIELNYDLWKGRDLGMLQPGDKLTIKYWKVAD